MSRNGTKDDPRVTRTRNALGNALMELMTQREFESITVQQVLDRAGVGRSTFYVHYDDKDDLFASDVDRFWASVARAPAGESSDRILPVRELFEHAAGMRDFQRALHASGKHGIVSELGRVHLARAIEQHLRRSPRARHLSRAHLEPVALMHAAALISLLEWWVEHSQPITASEADELFHRALWKSVGA